MDARAAKGRRWAGNTIKMFGIAVIARLFFAFRSGHQFKGLVEAAMILVVALGFAAIAFGLGWLSAGKVRAPVGNVDGSLPTPIRPAGSPATVGIPGETVSGTANDSGAPAPAPGPVPAPVPTPVASRPAREPGVADFDGARQRHELNAIVSAAFAAYPFLNDANEDFDQGAVDQVMKYRDFYAATGYPLPDALRKAVDDVCPRYASNRVARPS